MARSKGDARCHQLDTLKSDSASPKSSQQWSQLVVTTTTLEPDRLASNPNLDMYLLCDLREVT